MISISRDLHDEFLSSPNHNVRHLQRTIQGIQPRGFQQSQIAAFRCRRVIDAGTGSLQDIRPTDADIVKCRRRYDVFKASQQFPGAASPPDEAAMNNYTLPS